MPGTRRRRPARERHPWIMLLPIPLGAEGERRLPRLTLALVVANVLVFLLTGQGEHAEIAREEASLERAAAWELGKLTAEAPDLAAERREYPSALAFLEQSSRWRERAAPEARDRLDGYLAERQALASAHPFHRWGLVPARITPATLLTHQFLHADLLHIFFNMLFLWVVGGALEADWGGIRLLPFYLVSGAAAALLQASLAPRSVEPMIGASGAVAGLMGAFAAQHGRQPFRIALVYGLGLAPRVRLVTVPAWVFLGFWALEQLFWTLLTARIGVGVAFGAHLGGFVFGAATSFLVPPRRS